MASGRPQQPVDAQQDYYWTAQDYARAVRGLPSLDIPFVAFNSITIAPFEEKKLRGLLQVRNPDIRLECSEYAISVHKKTLCEKSGFFRGLCSTRCIDAENGQLDFKGVEVDLMWRFIIFLYTDCHHIPLDPKDPTLLYVTDGKSSNLSPYEILFKLHKFAAKHHVNQLCEQLEKAWLKFLNHHIVIDLPFPCIHACHLPDVFKKLYEVLPGDNKLRIAATGHLVQAMATVNEADHDFYALDKIAPILKEYEPSSFGLVHIVRNNRIELAASQEKHEKIRSLLRNDTKTQDGAAGVHCHQGHLVKRYHHWYVKCNELRDEIDIDKWLALPPSLPTPPPPPPPPPQQQQQLPVLTDLDMFLFDDHLVDVFGNPFNLYAQ